MLFEIGRSFGGERLSIDYARLPGSTLEQRRKAIEFENILVDILKFDGFFGANFDILTPKWIPTAVRPDLRRAAAWDSSRPRTGGGGNPGAAAPRDKGAAQNTPIDP